MNGLTLSPRRLGLLMRHELVTQRKSLTSGFTAIAGVVFGLFLIASASGGGDDFHASLFSNILLIGGFIVSSVAFAELQDSKTGIHYMMLPGSPVEKYVSKLLLTSVGWTLAVIVLYTLMTAVSTLVAQIFFATTPGVWLPVGRATWTTIATYLVTQSIFLFGSVYFRKVAFLKTVLSIVVVAASLGVIYLIAARIIFAAAFTGFLDFSVGAGDIASSAQIQLDQPQGRAFLGVLQRLGDMFTWVIVPIFFWVAGVLRLRETEV